MFKFIYLSMILFLVGACSVSESTGPTNNNSIEKPKPPTDKVGVWIYQDNIHSEDLEGRVHTVYNRGTYQLYITPHDPKKTYTWTSTKPAYTIITTNSDGTANLVIKGPNNTSDVQYDITATNENGETHTIKLNATISKAEKTKTIGGKRVELRTTGYDNFNDPMFSTNAANGFWLPGWSTTGSKRRYWSKDAIVFEDNIVDLRTRKGKPSDDGYHNGGWSINNQLDGPNKTRWISGSLHRRGVQGFGYYEARIKMNKKSDGHWDAFWAFEAPKRTAGTNGANGADELFNNTDIWYEYDMMEYTGKANIFDQTTHWWKKGGFPRVINSKTQKTPVKGVSNLKDWFILGLYWDGDTAIYYVNGEETIRLNATGGGSSSGTHGGLSAADITTLTANKGGYTGSKPLGVSPFTGMNFKFTTELGINYGGGDIAKFEQRLQQDLGDNGYDSFYIDYYAEYNIK